MSLSIGMVLVVLALVFLIVHAVRTGFPLWPSVLCLILKALVA